MNVTSSVGREVIVVFEARRRGAIVAGVLWRDANRREPLAEVSGWGEAARQPPVVHRFIGTAFKEYNGPQHNDRSLIAFAPPNIAQLFSLLQITPRH